MGKKKVGKKLLVYLTAFMMLFGTMPTNIFADVKADGKQSNLQIGDYYDADYNTGKLKSSPNLPASSTVEDYADGKVLINKTIAPTETENVFDVNLTVTTTQDITTITKKPDAAAVIVIDCSNSMYACLTCGHRHGYSSTENSDEVNSSCRGGKENNSDTCNCTSAIIKANGQRYHAAQYAAQAFINEFAEEGANRQVAVVVFSGSTSSNVNGATTVQNWISASDRSVKTSDETVLCSAVQQATPAGGTNLHAGILMAKNLLNAAAVKDMDYRNVILISDGSPTYAIKEGTSESTTTATDKICSNGQNMTDDGSATSHYEHTVVEGIADDLLRDGVSMYAAYIGQELIDCDSSASSCSVQNLNGDVWLDQNLGCIAYQADNTDEIIQSFKEIVDTIEKNAQAWTVTDPMGPYVDHIGPAATDNGEFSVSSDTLIWNLKKAEDLDPSDDTYKYSLTYQIKLDNLSDYETGEWTATNGITQLKYIVTTSVNNQQTSVEEGNAYFNVPSVKGLAGEYEFTKVDDKGDAVKDAVFTLTTADNPKWSMTATSDTNGKVKFTNIPSGHTYTLQETSVSSNYVMDTTPHTLTVSYGNVTVDGKSEDDAGYNITVVNEKQELIPIEGKKTWNHGNNSNYGKPTSITLNLYANGVIVATKTVSGNRSDNTWDYTFGNYPANDENGNPIEYKVLEEPVNNYYPTYSTDGYDITNTYQNNKTNVTVLKNWDDGGNQDNMRPESITVKLTGTYKRYGNTVICKEETQQLNEANGWTYTFSNLDKTVRVSGSNYNVTYSISEVTQVSGYTTTVGTLEDGVVVITNKHTPIVPDPVKIVINGEKTLNGRDMKAGEEFKFTITAANDATANAVAAGKITGLQTTPESVTGGTDGVGAEFSFDELTFTKEGTYKFYVSEVAGNASGVTYDNHKCEVTVTVTDDRKGNLHATVSYGEGNTKASFVNQYSVDPTSAQITATKQLRGAELEKDAFTFILKDAEGNKVTAKNDAEGNVVFDLEYDKAGTYTYTLYEKAGTDKNITYDATEHEITVTVTDDGKGQLNAVVTYPEATAPEFTNTYNTISIPATKVWDDANNQDGKRPESITFNLMNGNDVVDSKELTAGILEVTFDKLPEFDADGNAIKYTVVEVLPEGTEYTSKVTGSIADGFVVTNSYTPEKTAVTVKKVWEDKNDQDGKRPETLKVTLSNGQEVTLSEANGWEETITGLPKYADGKEINYTWQEETINEKYSAEYAVAGTVTTITNTYPVETTEATVKKVWNDNNDQDGKRPEYLTVTLSNGQQVTLNESNNWTTTVTNLPKYENKGQLIEYTWTEDEGVLPEGYELTSTSKDGTVTTLTNSYTPAVTEATVKKVWDDEEDQDGKRPDSLEVTLKADNEVVETVTLNEGNKWTAKVSNLPKFSKGQELQYTWEESVVPEGHTLTGNSTAGTVTTLTNKHVPEETEVSVTKVWNDKNNEDGVRPESITVVLKANGEETDSITLNESNNWTYQWTNLAKNEAGKEIQYTVYEKGIDEKEYSVEVEGNNNNFVITNTHPVVIDVKVKKVWDDAGNQDGKRPDSVEVQLYANGEATGEPVTLNADNNWKNTWEDLNKYDDNKDLIEYTVDEVRVPNGYTKAVKGTMEDGFTITNSHTPAVTEATVKKVWDDEEDQDGKRPDSLVVTLSNGTEVTLNEGNDWTATVQNLPKFSKGQEIEYTWTENELPEGYTLTNTVVSGTLTTLTNSHIPAVTKAKVIKVWDDKDNQDGKRPESLTVTLSNGTEVVLNDANKWTATVENLPKFSKGQLIEYTWTEDKDGLPEGYKLTSTSKDGTVTTLTNSYTPEVTEAEVVKVWDDAENQDGKRPESIKATLSNGTEVTLSEANDWSAKVTNLPKFKDGEEINYTWTEDEEGLPEGYELTDTSKNGTVTTLTNSYTPKTTAVTVKKVWDDANNQDGKRPESIEVELSNGTNVTLSEDNGWTATVKNLPKYADGKEITYTWTESELPEGYILTNTSTEGALTTLTNSYEPKYTTASIKKVWDDANNQDGKRPESLTVTLSNGTDVILNDANDWSATVEKLPVYANGKIIEYTWSENEEELPEGYELTGEVTEGTLTTLTNSYTPEVTKAEVVKVWDDADNQDGKRPESIEVTLSNGTSVTLNAENGWTATVEDLPVYQNGNKIEYTWTEDAEGLPEGYTLTDTSVNGTVTTLTNSYTPEETTATVVKVWDDEENQDGKRPESIEVELSNGTKVTLNDANDWTATVEGLPKYANGNEIEYTWTESKVPEGYELTDTSKDGSVTTLTNSHTPAVTEATVKKVWNDKDNQDGKRPDSLVVTLSDGTEVTLNGDNKWTATVKDLPKYADGKEIEYTWTEDKLPEGYSLTETSKDGLVTTLTNSHTPETTAVTVKKVWDDANNQDGKRPESIEVELSNGTKVTLNDANKWTATVEKLPKYADGKEITYTWTESRLPKGYVLTKTSTEGALTTLTNSYKPEVTTASIKKVWDDADNQDGKRPEELKVTLSNGTSVTLNEENGWAATVDNLPVYQNGKKIEYTWTEDKLPEGYSLTGTVVSGTETILTNSYTPKTTAVTVKKVWDDAGNQDGKRPANLTVTLSNGDSVTLNEENDWTATIEGLPKFSKGQEIEYKWTENGLPEGYELTDTSKEGTVTTLTNSHTPEKTTATVKKVWDDAKNQDGKRPESLTVTLIDGINSTEDKTVVLNEGNQWTATVNDLPKFSNGQEIQYTWTEGEVPEGYELTGKVTNGTVTTLTNSYTPETTAVTVKKVWDDAGNQDGMRPESIEVKLSNGTTVTLSEENSWTATVRELPKYKDGVVIEYTWTEADIEGYELTDTSVDGTVTTLTNSHTPEKTEATVKKVWDDAGNQDGMRPESLTVALSNGDTVTLNEANQWTATVTNLPKYKDGEEIDYIWTENGLPEGYELTETSKDGTVTTLTNSHIPEKTDVTVKKIWDDANNQDGMRPESLTVTLSNGDTVTLNEDNEWTATVKNLPKYKDGEEIEYKWAEADIEGYELTDTSVSGTVTTLTNSHTPEETEATVKKVWDDAGNQDGIRPDSLTVTLSNGTEVALSAENNWTVTVENLPKFSNGQEIEYTWTESEVPEGYTLTGNSKEGTVTTLTNKHVPEEIDVTVKKVWDDANNQDGKRPESLTVTLSNGDTVTLNDANKWTATIDGLPKYDNGVEIQYAWTEDAEGLPEGYVLTDTSVDGTVTTLTNSYKPEEMSVTVKKVWDDANNQDGIRPESLTVSLSNGDTVTLKESNNWTATVDNLPVYNAGEKIDYTWTEGNLPEGYELTDTSVSGTITTLTNKHVPEETEVTVKKVWDDANNQDGKRPETLVVTLSNGKAVTLNAENNWKVTVEGLPKYADGKEIEYKWTEGKLPEGYELIDTSVDGKVTTLTNSHTPEETEATVKKVWDDADNQDGMRPESLTVTLSNGDTVTLNEENEWTATIEDLPKYKDGKEIEYKWTEADINGYELTDTSVDGTVTTLTNKHNPEVTEASVKKVWNDANNQDGKRPTELTVTLIDGINSTEDKTVVLNEDNQWTATVTDLPVYNAGEKIDYTWEEADIDGYELTSSITEGTLTTLTNTHQPETVELTVFKRWQDKHDKYEKRPREIIVYLEADGEVIDTVKITQEDKWAYTFTGLPVYEDGEKIIYTVSEEPVDGYITEIEDMTITNIIDPEELDDIADTGDDSKPWAYGFAGLMAFITALGALFLRRREE